MSSAAFQAQQEALASAEAPAEARLRRKEEQFARQLESAVDDGAARESPAVTPEIVLSPTQCIFSRAQFDTEEDMVASMGRKVCACATVSACLVPFRTLTCLPAVLLCAVRFFYPRSRLSHGSQRAHVPAPRSGGAGASHLLVLRARVPDVRCLRAAHGGQVPLQAAG